MATTGEETARAGSSSSTKSTSPRPRSPEVPKKTTTAAKAPAATTASLPTEDPEEEGESESDAEEPEVVEPPRPRSPNRPQQDGFTRAMGGLTGLSEDQVNLLKELYIANGQDAYDAEAAAVGRLKQEEYLALPKGLKIPIINPEDVGRAHVRDRFKIGDLAAIYLLNKRRAPAGDNAVTYAMLRMEAVKMGWFAGQKEVVFIDFTEYATAVAELVQDLAAVKSQLQTFRLGAFLIPLVCEHTFRTMGHHYISGMAVEYQTRYRKTLKACLASEIMDLLQPSNLFHHVLHWVSPSRSFNVLSAQLTTATLPDALVIRASAPPAGWALVTTTAAVISAMESSNVFSAIQEEFGDNLDVVRDASHTVRADVRKYHKAYFAYGIAPPAPRDLEALEAAKEVAIKFAPYAQGFIDGTLRDAALGQAQALKKHAELNPVAKAKAARFFRMLARSQASNVSELFSGELPGRSARDDDD